MKQLEKTLSIENDAILLCDSHHGVYIPKLVLGENIENTHFDFSECSKEDIELVLNGDPYESEGYWDAWHSIMCNTKVTSDEGIEYFIMYNEDLWLVPCECADELENWII